MADQEESTPIEQIASHMQAYGSLTKDRDDWHALSQHYTDVIMALKAELQVLRHEHEQLRTVLHDEPPSILQAAKRALVGGQ